jgi:signal transduction histidine kinase
MVGLMVEVHRAFQIERDSRRELAAAYAAERRKVEELEALDRTRAELLRMATHELLHPVAVVRSWIVTLRHRWDALDDEQKLDVLGKLDGESRRLADVAERTPEVTGAGAQALAFPIVPRTEWVIELMNEAEAADGLDGRLRVDLAADAARAWVLADATRVLQVFRNLLSNATKHAGPDPSVVLSARVSGRGVLFTVADRGPGIPTEDLDRVFELGFRVDPQSGEAPGTGLGLYICRRIVEAHGGRIWAERRLGGGTAINFTLPLVESEP